jgi:hypothetical protein
MALPDLVRAHALAAGAVAGLLLGVAGGLLWPLPAATAPAAGDLQLALPTRAALARYSDADFAALRNSPLWSGSAGGQAAGANMKSWRLLGVVTRPTGAALVQVDNRQLNVPVGAQLPDGAQLVAVGPNAVLFRRGDCDFRRTLYATADVALPTEGCASAPAPNAAPQAAGN